MDIYLDISHPSTEGFQCPLYTKIVLFVLQHCKSDSVVHLVDTKITKGAVETLSILQGIAYKITPKELLSGPIRNVQLPALVPPGGVLVHAGLCAVLRQIVKAAHRQYPENNFQDLMGHHENCLKACAEVSVWTKFCEVDLPGSLEKFLFDRTVEPCQILLELRKLENHLNQRPIVRNRGKRTRALKKTKIKTEISSKNGGKKSDDNLLQAADCDKTPSLELMNEDVDLLKHTYAEGIDMTLTDLVLYLCIHIFLESSKKQLAHLRSSFPLITKWYNHLSSLRNVQGAAKDSGIVPLDFAEDDYSQTAGASDLDLSVILSEMANLDIRETAKQKPKAKPENVSHILEMLQASGVGSDLGEHPCGNQVHLDWESLPKAAHPSEGELPASRTARKCQQLENLATAVVSLAQPGDVIVDFCAGGGHLGIVVACLLPECHVVLVENKEESIGRACSRVESLGITNITLYQCNLDYYHGKFDVGTCLHACGVATDLVLQKCLDCEASFVICPCCYGGIQDTHTVTYPRSRVLKESGIEYKDYIRLGHAADQTEVNIPLSQQGKTCMCIIDTDRAYLAKEAGYTAQICSLQPPTCTPKNDLIIGTKQTLAVS